MNTVFRSILTLSLLVSSLTLFAEAPTSKVSSTEELSIKEVPSHHVNGKFRNPYMPADFQPSTIAFLKARFFDDMEWPDEPENYRENWQAPDLERIHNPDFNKAQATLIGHSTVLLQYLINV